MNIIYQKGEIYKYNIKCDDIMNEIYWLCTCVIETTNIYILRMEMSG